MGASKFRWLLPFSFVGVLIALWQLAVSAHPGTIVPGPWMVLQAIGDLARRGLLLKYAVASLFRVTWGFLLAAVVGIPLGLLLGLNRRVAMALNAKKRSVLRATQLILKTGGVKRTMKMIMPISSNSTFTPSSGVRLSKVPIVSTRPAVKGKAIWITPARGSLPVSGLKRHSLIAIPMRSR